ncbi:hypothetical protein P3T42_003516 [Paraburkholderia sp. GAS38]|jgi:hypothetical protein|uniref:hypothetical protein n=1 Tax=Paraburkholderia sp. GAS38 TaxID=3035133 RepID=UPI003D1DEF2E
MFRIAYVAVAVSAIACAAPVFAQDAPTAAQPAATVGNGDANVNGTANSGVGMDTSGQTAAGSPAGLTRQEVKRELYQAETDGQIKMLNRTVYNGS